MVQGQEKGSSQALYMGPLPEAVGGGVRRARQKCCVLDTFFKKKNDFKTKEKPRNSRYDDT